MKYTKDELKEALSNIRPHHSVTDDNLQGMLRSALVAVFGNIICTADSDEKFEQIRNSYAIVMHAAMGLKRTGYLHLANDDNECQSCENGKCTTGEECVATSNPVPWDGPVDELAFTQAWVNTARMQGPKQAIEIMKKRMRKLLAETVPQSSTQALVDVEIEVPRYFCVEDLEFVAEGLRNGYESKINVGNVSGEGDETIASTTGAAAHFIECFIRRHKERLTKMNDTKAIGLPVLDEVTVTHFKYDLNSLREFPLPEMIKNISCTKGIMVKVTMSYDLARYMHDAFLHSKDSKNLTREDLIKGIRLALKNDCSVEQHLGLIFGAPLILEAKVDSDLNNFGYTVHSREFTYPNKE